MEHEQTLTKQSMASDEPLSLPQFDEEATLLSARPVVPLHEVKVGLRSRSRMVFGLAFVAALAVGAVGALVIHQHGERPEQTSAAESATEPAAPVDSFPASGAVGGSEIVSTQPVISVVEPTVATGTDASKEASSARTPTGAQKQLPRISRSVVRPDTAALIAQDSEEDPHNEEIELRREERRETRRLRRERRNSRVGRGDDLMRIREIFEGSPRP